MCTLIILTSPRYLTFNSSSFLTHLALSNHQMCLHARAKSRPLNEIVNESHDASAITERPALEKMAQWHVGSQCLIWWSTTLSATRLRSSSLLLLLLFLTDPSLSEIPEAHRRVEHRKCSRQWPPHPPLRTRRTPNSSSLASDCYTTEKRQKCTPA